MMGAISGNGCTGRDGVSANDFADAADDSEMIQRAIDAAARSGIRTARVPSVNARTGASVWTIARTLLLPSAPFPFHARPGSCASAYGGWRGVPYVAQQQRAHP